MQITIEAGEEKAIELTVIAGRDFPLGSLIICMGLAFITTSHVYAREAVPSDVPGIGLERITLNACEVPFVRAIGVIGRKPL